jgi:hypothetical protein
MFARSVGGAENLIVRQVEEARREIHHGFRLRVTVRHFYASVLGKMLSNPRTSSFPEGLPKTRTSVKE